MLTLTVDLVNHAPENKSCKEQKKRDRPSGAISLRKSSKDKRLGRARLVLCFRKHAPTIERVVDDLAHCRSLRIYVHSVARFEMSDDALSRYLERHAIELRKSARLDMIDSHKPLVQRQVCIKSHDCLNSSN